MIHAPLFSIIVPIYNVEPYLRQCVDSILNQSVQDFQVILVDDGSPDGSAAICDEYAQKDDRVRVVHKKNGGLVSARKAGLAVAEGEYICFVDGDDFVAPDMLETYESAISAQPVDMISVGFSAYYPDGRVTIMEQTLEEGFYDKTALKEKIYPNMLSTEPFFSFLIFPSIWSKCIRKHILEAVYCYVPDDLTMGEDTAVTYPALMKASSLYVKKYCGYMYRQNQSSMTHTYDKKLYSKVRNLLAYLSVVAADGASNFEDQVNEYALFLLLLAKNNEYILNTVDGYRSKNKNMRMYLDDPLFKNAINRVKVNGLRNKMILFCFKTHFLQPIYFYEMIWKKRQIDG